jgi:hypothetical protein
MMISKGHVHICPLCGAGAERVHRHFADRLLGVFRSVHRYRCVRAGCGWEGIVSKDERPPAGGDGAGTRPGLRTRALWFLAGCAFALAAVQATRMILANKAAHQASVTAAARHAALPPIPVAEGESYDGEALAGDDPRQLQNETPLVLARGCAWGIPGRNPYRGTVAQALTAARVPESAVRKFESLVANKQVSDQLLISRDGIVTASGRRRFEAKSFDMAFGNTLCFNTRVNFRGNHTETADLYEATDADGHQYTIMVPIVCGNVSVLGERAERNGGGGGNGSTPEPATLALVALGFGMLLALLGRRARN